MQYRSISIGAVKKQAPTKKNPKRPVVSKSTYVVVKGDMLSTIAAKKLGSAKRWKEIYNLNKGAIEKAAIKKRKKIFRQRSLDIPWHKTAPAYWQVRQILDKPNEDTEVKETRNALRKTKVFSGNLCAERK